MPRVYKRAAARRDLFSHYIYLANNASLAIADRFLSKAEATFAELARQPTIGAQVMPQRLTLRGLRKWRVKAFRHFLVFYVPRADGVSIIRVLHSARNWPQLFAARL
jgi:toxin ParE1/3/4